MIHLSYMQNQNRNMKGWRWLSKKFGFTTPDGPEVFAVLTLDDNREGDVKMSRVFLTHGWLTRADALRDAIGLLNREYEATLADWKKVGVKAEETRGHIKGPGEMS